MPFPRGIVCMPEQHSEFPVTRSFHSPASSPATCCPKDVLRPELLDWSSYHVPDSSGMVKLDAMENPYSLPAELQREMGTILARAPINRYPDAGCTALKSRLRDYLSVPNGCEILLGNGSDEIIQILCMAVARPGATIMGVEPSFVMYRVSAAAAGAAYVSVPLTDDFQLDLQQMLEVMRNRRPALVFLAFPNNPTGNLFRRADVMQILDAAPGLVVIDEAYHAFARQSLMSELVSRPNLLIMRTLSKLGLAGLRLGMVVGRSAWIAEFDKLRLPYNVNVLSQLAADFVLSHVDLLERQAEQLLLERQCIIDALQGTPGVQVFPSDANFVTFRVADACAVFDGLKQRQVLIKNLHLAHPMLRNCLRVTIGTPAENRMFLHALNELDWIRENVHVG